MSDVKFRGKGHEAEDLQRIMARVEHWSHRLFPKFQFDDFIEKVEKLGSKKVVQVVCHIIKLSDTQYVVFTLIHFIFGFLFRITSRG